MVNEEKCLVDGLVEELNKLGAEFSSTQINFKKDGKEYVLVVGLRYVGEVQQEEK